MNLKPYWKSKFLATTVSCFSFLAAPCNAQYQSGVGIESANSSSIQDIVINRTIYTGECPGSVQYPEKVYFVSDTRPPSPGLRVKLTNMSRGLSPDDPPYTDRSYSQGRASESFLMALGSAHEQRYFIVRPGQNLMQFEISKDGNRMENGTFNYNVRVTERTEYRNKVPQEVTKYTDDGKRYKTTEYRCPQD